MLKKQSQKDKITSGMSIKDIGLPRTVTLSLSQSVGTPSECKAQINSHVRRGDIVGIATGNVSSNIHTPISGTVIRIEPMAAANGSADKWITIVADDIDHYSDLQSICDAAPIRTDKEIESFTPDELISIIRDAGIVELGGEPLPSYCKLNSSADTLIIDGTECEPYLTCDEAIMLQQSADIVEGVRYMMKASNVNRAIIGIDKNKPNLIELMRRVAHRYPEIEVSGCRIKNPEEVEKRLTATLTGRRIPPDSSPISVGVIVSNVSTSLAVYHAVKWGIPLMERVVTVTGLSVKSPGNYRVPIGTCLSDVVKLAGGVPDDTGKIIIAGQENVTPTLDTPSVKGISGIIFLPDKPNTNQNTFLARLRLKIARLFGVHE